MNIDRSLAFSALLDMTDWFGPMDQRQGIEEVTVFLRDWEAAGKPPMYAFAVGRRPAA